MARAAERAAILLCTACLVIGARAQGLAERRISVQAERAPLGTVLSLIAREGGFRLSYNAAAVPADSLVSLHAQDWTVQRALRAVLPPQLPWKEGGQHLIITAAPGRRQRFEAAGVIVDAATGASVAGATVFEMRRSNAVATGTDGGFRLPLSGELERTPLLVARNGYQDTVVFVERGTPVRLGLRPVPGIDPMDPICHFDRCGVEELGAARLLIPASRVQLAENMGYAERRAIQLSLVPGVSTNGTIAGAVVNEVSVNVLAGYARGLDGLELGGGINLLSHDMKGLQVAGMGNLVGGTVRGVQLAGGVNHSMRAMKGLQVAGLGNTVWDTLTGAQVSGAVNVVKRGMSGTQVSGAVNVAIGDMDGVQVSGAVNAVTGTVNKAQVSGALNYAGAVQGGQVCGGVNIAKGEVGGGQVGFGANYAANVTGGQFSFGANVVPGTVAKGQVGFGLNYAGDVTGGQFGFGLNLVPGTLQGAQVGVLNIAKRVIGSQVGIINLSDSIAGCAVGVLSISRKGYHRFDAVTTDVMPLSLHIRTGTRAFHNILGYSPPLTNDDRWGFLYGFGFEPRFTPAFFLNVDLTGEQIVEHGDWLDAVNILGRFSLTPGVLIAQRIAVSAGPVANALVTDWFDPETGVPFSAVPPADTAYEEEFGDVRVNGWLGWKASVGVRF